VTRRALILTVVVVAALAGVFVIHRLNTEQEYRRLLAEGERLADGGQTTSAIDAFTRAIAIRPTSMVAYYHRGEAYAAQGRHDSALRDLTEARRIAPEAPQPLEALGRLADRRGEPGEAADWYSQAVERARSADAQLLYALALARYRAGAPAAARAPLRTALARDDRFAEAQYLLGLVSRDANEFEEAQTALEQAVRLNPRLLAAREELADLYRARGRGPDELLQLRALAAVDPRIERYLALADASVRADRFPDAFAAVAQAEAVDSTDSRVALALGRVHLARAERTGDSRDVPLALAALERALGGTARRSEGLTLYGRALYLSGDIAEAERLLHEAISTSPVELEAFGYLADAAERLGHADVAEHALAQLDALEGDTVDGDVRADRARRIGALALRAGHIPAAVSHLDTAVKAGITDATTLGLLARARWANGDQEAARELVRQALAADRTNAELSRLERTMR